MSDKELRVEALRVVQNGPECYVGVMDSEVLRRIAVVSRREGDNSEGYQRYLNQSRLKEVGQYIANVGATFPNSIVVCFAKSDVRYEPSANPHQGTLVIPDRPETAFIVDGQHRLFGFEYAGGTHFDLIVAAYIGLPIGQQAAIFTKINSTQKGVSPSLIYDLLDLTKNGEFTTERAHELVKSLNEDGDSPWQGMIKMIGRGPGVVSQAAFVGELRKLLQAKDYFAGSSEDKQLLLLKMYFGAWKELFSSAWGNKKYVLCKTMGLAAMLGVLRKIVDHCLLENHWTQRNMVETLRGISTRSVPEFGGTPLDFSSDQLNAYGGRQGQKKLIEIVDAGIPEVRPDFGIEKGIAGE